MGVVMTGLLEAWSLVWSESNAMANNEYYEIANTRIDEEGTQ